MLASPSAIASQSRDITLQVWRRRMQRVTGWLVDQFVSRLQALIDFWQAGDGFSNQGIHCVLFLSDSWLLKRSAIHFKFDSAI